MCDARKINKKVGNYKVKYSLLHKAFTIKGGGKIGCHKLYLYRIGQFRQRICVIISFELLKTLRKNILT
jgi:hypothetical protein